MAQYNFTLSTKGVRHELAKDLTVSMMEESKWTQFMGTTNNHIIKTKLHTELSATSTFRLRGVLTGDGVEGNDDFDTNEEELSQLYQVVSLENFGNSVISGSKTKLLKQVHFIDFITEAKDALHEWGSRKLDVKIYTKLSTACTNIVYCDHHASILATDVVVGNTLSVADVREARRRAVKGVDAAGNRVPKLRPIKVIIDDVQGVKVKRKIFLMKVGDDSAISLTNDPLWTELQAAAETNNLNSPLFSSKLGVIDDIIIVNDGTASAEEAGILTSTEITAYAGTGVKTEINLLLGASAGLMPMDSGFNWYEEKYDKDRKASVGVDRDLGFAKAKFEGATAQEIASVWHQKDYGVVAVVAAVK